MIFGGHLLETENKTICRISGPKSGCSRLRNLSSDCLREFLKQYKVVAYGRWLPMRSGRYERVDCILMKTKNRIRMV